MLDDVLFRVVYSKAGHDKGKRFAVIGIADDAHVLIVDGDSRKCAKPKRKKLLHLQFENRRIEGLDAALNDKGNTVDAFLRAALCAAGTRD